VQVDMTA